MIVSGWDFHRFLAALWIRLVVTAVRQHGVRGSVIALRSLRNVTTGTRAGHRLRKAVRSGNRYTIDVYCPALPSPAGDRFLAQEIRRNFDRTSGNVLQTAIVAITTECPLRCEHCLEWDALNRPDTLTRDDLTRIVTDLRARGVAQIFFTGGEPMRRIGELLDVCKGAGESMDLWIITSGVGMTASVARQMSEGRFTGVVLSIDHWSAERHDAFRGRRGVFEAAMAAARHARAAGLMLAFSICPTREFVTRDNLRQYATLAQSAGASFIQIMEPRAVGHYAGRDVLLSPAELATLEEFSDWMNFHPANRNAPIVTYPALYQRRYGCMGAAERYLYLDTNGDAHACPFCRHAAANVVRDGLDAAVRQLRQRGCPAPSVCEVQDAASCDADRYQAGRLLSLTDAHVTHDERTSPARPRPS